MIRTHRLFLYLGLIFLAPACQHEPLSPELYFQQKRVLFLGNSITQNGTYVSFIQYFLQREHPDWETDIVSIGLSSETVSCLTEKDHPFPRPCLRERLDRALEKIQPDVVFACYGMNDGIYHPPDPQREKAYREGILHLIEKVRKAGASLVLLTPPPFDPLPIRDRLVDITAPNFGYQHPYEGYDEVLAGYARWLRSLANDEIRVIDWHTAINRHLADSRKTDPVASFSQDGIHPSAEGHLFMAREFLKAFGMDSPAIAAIGWDSLVRDASFQRLDEQRRMRSAAMLGFVGYTRGEKVATLSPRPLLILMGGQSNMVGLGKKEDLGSVALPEQIKLVDRGLSANLTADPSTFGPEIGLAKVLNREFPHQPVILLKYAIGGSSLLDWSPDHSPEKAKITGHPEFGNIYESFFQKIDSIVQLYDPEITAVLWMQGERDARIPEAGKDYAENLRRLVTAFRERTGMKDLPFVIGVINPPPSRYPAVAKVQEAQRLLARELPHVYTFETDSLSKWPDDLHYDSEGQLALGNIFGEVLVNVMTVVRGGALR